MKYANVQEHWGLVDTVMAVPDWPQTLPQGWFTGLVAMGASPDIPFFNVRNRNVGIMYCNQDTRDQFPYAMRLFSIGVSFWRTHMTTFQDGGQEVGYDDQISHIFCNDLPRHCSLVLQIQQDERLRTHVLFAQPGYGPVGGGWGRGTVTGLSGGYQAGVDTHLSTTNQGVAELNRRWHFPDNIQIPRRASVSAKLRFSEYGRNLLQAMGAVGAYQWVSGPDAPAANPHAGQAGIQVSLIGERLVQQRGQYHA